MVRSGQKYAVAKQQPGRVQQWLPNAVGLQSVFDRDFHRHLRDGLVRAASHSVDQAREQRTEWQIDAILASHGVAALETAGTEHRRVDPAPTPVPTSDE